MSARPVAQRAPQKQFFSKINCYVTSQQGKYILILLFGVTQNKFENNSTKRDLKVFEIEAESQTKNFDCPYHTVAKLGKDGNKTFKFHIKN